jgi:hypothetical protein
MPGVERLQPFGVEAAHQRRHGIAGAAARLLRGLYIRRPSRDGQNLFCPQHMTGGFALRAADPL